MSDQKIAPGEVVPAVTEEGQEEEADEGEEPVKKKPAAKAKTAAKQKAKAKAKTTCMKKPAAKKAKTGATEEEDPPKDDEEEEEEEDPPRVIKRPAGKIKPTSKKVGIEVEKAKLEEADGGHVEGEDGTDNEGDAKDDGADDGIESRDRAKSAKFRADLSAGRLDDWVKEAWDKVCYLCLGDHLGAQ